MVPEGWSIESTKIRRAALERGGAPPVDRGLIRLFRVLRVEGIGEEGPPRRGLCWRTDEDGLRLIVFDPEGEEPASGECFRMGEGVEGETWCFGGAAEIALGLAA